MGLLHGVAMRLTLTQAFGALVLLLAGASLFFTVGVVRFQRGLKAAGAGPAVVSGASATYVQAVDGDEVSVRIEGQPLTVRLLGISAFDPAIQDPLVQPFGRAAMQHLDQLAAGRAVTLHFEELAYDRKRRLLAHLHVGSVDAGLELVSRGLALTYTRYPFGRMGVYLQAEAEARERRAGLWAEAAASTRATQLRVVWDQERARED